MAGLEILIAIKDLRTGFGAKHAERLGAALAGMTERLDSLGDGKHAVALSMLLWTTPVAMMIAEMFIRLPLDVEDAQAAITRLIDVHRRIE